MEETIKPIETISEVISELEGVEGLEADHGERFRGWYLTKTPENKTILPLGYKDLVYEFPFFDYRFKFFIPMVITFNRGSIFYKSGERRLGIFRFPCDSSGNYMAPIPLDPKKLMDLSTEQIVDLIKDRRVLLFEAFKTPQFGFSFFSLSADDFKKIKGMTDKEFFEKFKSEYDFQYSKKVDSVKDKILSLPNYLLILLSILNKELKDVDEAARITDNIIRNEI